MSVERFPVSDDLGACDLLAASAQRPFKQVLILGVYEDGIVRHASTMTKAQELHLMELYKLVLLGVAAEATIR